MTTIKPYTPADFDAFTRMVADYFLQDLNQPLNQNPPVNMCQRMIQSVTDQATYLDLLHQADTPIGFIMYQVDSPRSNWNEKEGHGFIREMYIHKDHRSQGHGQALATHAENALRRLSVPAIYLTSSKDGFAFWLRLGYTDTHEICAQNNNPILIKPNPHK